ncbi:Serine/threonine-protein kinase wnk1 [Dissophora ornata]|nr:Serine/threonine-protein kinase wnk1 [Dissophora ornata]
MGASIQSDQTNDDGDTHLETDPTGRFQRLTEVLGEGAYKLVYRAFDQEEGVEVAWNQLRIDHLTQKEAQKILSEIEILESIRNDHIINFYASWSSRALNGGERVVFVTELMSSGTLKQYLKKTLKGSLKPKVLKSWCRQILQGLVYLHTHDPPIIHRDLKCDNIFINGNNGQLKIGDLGLAVVRHRTHVSSVLGTPEFMAPELYDEKYDEKVDIYAFGMCVTKEYPYSECTNQAQIYRKVTKGIKPQSLDHVQDPDIWEFINRCLDYDDRTRPSAQELLDSDFLKPCVVIPPPPGSSLGMYNYPNRSVTEAMDFSDGHASASLNGVSYRSSFLDPSIISPPSSYSLPTPIPAMLPKTLPSPVKANPHPQYIAIPESEFTCTTTVDADNKTYHIRSNLVPQTPTTAVPNPFGQLPEPEATQQHEDATVELPTLHSHANSKTCSIQVVQYGEGKGDQLDLKMICTCPVAGPQDVTMAAGTHEIKFPFDLNVDTVEEVVAEMIREQILSGDDREEATTKIQDLIDDVVLVRKERARAAREERARATKAADHHGRTSPQHHGGDHTNRSISTGLKHGHHHRQLNAPSVFDLEQYGTSPTESNYDHYSSVGSNASAGWTGNESPVESDQGYGTVPPKRSQQPPVITETTFPPLHIANQSHGRVAETAEELSGTQGGKQQLVSYSDVVQTSNAGQHPLSPNLGGRDRYPVAPRPHSLYGVDQKLPTPVSPDAKPVTTNGALTKHALRDIEAASGDRKKAADREDVGYTSPYRHGVSSSSISYHRRSPSMDASFYTTLPTPSPTPAQVVPSEPTLGSLGKMDQHHLNVAAVPSTGGSPEIRPTVSRDSPSRGISALALNGHVPHTVVPAPPLNSDAGLSYETLSANDPVLQRLTPRSPSIRPHTIHSDQRVPQSVNTQHPNDNAFAAMQKPVLQTFAGQMMTNEAKKDIELWSNKVQNPERINETGYTNGSSISSGPEMSDEEDILDEDLKVLREKQQRELESMRVQHERQMMKLKEQKGLQERVRRKSDVNGGTYSPAPSSIMQQ